MRAGKVEQKNSKKTSDFYDLSPLKKQGISSGGNSVRLEDFSDGKLWPVVTIICSNTILSAASTLTPFFPCCDTELLLLAYLLLTCKSSLSPFATKRLKQGKFWIVWVFEASFL